ncbi:RWD domain-containing protein 3 [Pristis pectinata]|uniref:RWD domain-containing protein 3 n=1 Tax=Pristis pectinata TaxID=685728 RepID=UPI00223E458D|nr:RWD domain-containing protein 3 [Pristis pectinata]
MAAEEEAAALRAIYNGDFQLLSQSESEGITFQICDICEHHTKKMQFKVTFQLSPGYPYCLPDISISSDQLSRKQCSDLKQNLLRYAETLLSQPMVYELMTWLQQNTENSLGQPTVGEADEGDNQQHQTNADDGTWMALLHLDHMRAKGKYIRSIEKWTSDLRLTGRLMFMGKLILILLQGEKKDIKDYLVLQKTTKVDVDSSGKRCKEKMISVLCEEKLQAGQQRLTDFAVKEFTSGCELHQEFEALGLSDLYDKFVQF